MARAALLLIHQHETTGDPRIPIAMALVHLAGPSASDAELTEMVDALLPIELGTWPMRQPPHDAAH